MREFAEELRVAAHAGDAFATLCVRDCRSFDDVLADLTARLERPGAAPLVAVVDGAKLSGGLGFLDDYPAAAQCLALPEFASTIRHAAPHLVSVPDRGALRALFREAWAHRAVMFLESARPMASLLTHLRAQTIAARPDGELTLFRWFDPAVFATFTRIVEADQYADFFAGVVEAACYPGARSELVTVEFPHAWKDYEAMPR